MVNRYGRSLPVALLLVVLLALSAAPALSQRAPAATPQPDAANAALDWLRTQQQPDGGFSAFGGASDPSVTADVVYAFAAAGINAGSLFAPSGAFTEDYLLHAAQSVASDPGKAAKLVLVFHILGEDPNNAGGAGLVEAISQSLNAQTGWYGISFYGHSLAVLALASQDVDIPDAAIDAILTAQTPEGSWGFNGDPTAGTGDSNSTAIAIQALVTVDGDRDAINRGLDYLRSLQNAGTGAIAYDTASVNDPGGDANSTALAIQAFVAAGEDPSTLEHGDLLTALLTFQNESGAFQFQPAFPDDSLLATAQAVPALLLKAFPYEPLPELSPLSRATAPAAPDARCAYQDVTQHNLCEPFAAYWHANGGLANFGYPLTEAFDDNGRTFQYFERAIFELHPENAGTPYEVLLTRVGWDAYLLAHGGAMTGADPIGGECLYFNETTHNLCGGFGAFWEQFGGLAVFGYPISEEMQEDGMTVQYFERARFEWHPGDWPERYDVLLGRLAADALDRELDRVGQ
ncbi:MAG TPA: prenyltransferase/squalene oxidase repeat-containing protein [Thermomicrobiales bacterium]|nr:prenyltransferase/squalene oxidase repeat-containing protein [Thermomicrobiales bacterium]